MRREKVIIVGGGTSGMAAASCLTKQSIPYIILEREDCSASMWKKYTYDRLHLHLVKRVCELPFFPFPNSYPNYVPRKLFVEYLETYEKHFDMKILYHRCVVLAEYDEAEQLWRVKAQNRSTGEVEEYGGRFLVVASGEDKPHVPRVEGLESFRGRAIHSTSYRNGKEYRDEHVLVVGSGNSGMEIALDLANFGAKPSIVARTPVHFLSRNMMNYGSLLLWYLSTETMEKLLAIVSRIVYGDLSKYGLPFPSEGPFTMKRKYGKFPVIDLGTIKKIKSGEIQVLPTEIESIRGNEVLFRGGKSFPFDSIIFCTGFKRTTQKWLKGFCTRMGKFASHITKIGKVKQIYRNGEVVGGPNDFKRRSRAPLHDFTLFIATVLKSCIPKTTSEDCNRLQYAGNRLRRVEIVVTQHDFKFNGKKRTGNRLRRVCNRLPGCFWWKIDTGKRLQGRGNRLPVCFWLVYEILYCNCGGYFEVY